MQYRSVNIRVSSFRPNCYRMHTRQAQVNAETNWVLFITRLSEPRLTRIHSFTIQVELSVRGLVAIGFSFCVAFKLLQLSCILYRYKDLKEEVKQTTGLTDQDQVILAEKGDIVTAMMVDTPISQYPHTSKADPLVLMTTRTEGNRYHLFKLEGFKEVTDGEYSLSYIMIPVIRLQCHRYGLVLLKTLHAILYLYLCCRDGPRLPHVRNS